MTITVTNAVLREQVRRFLLDNFLMQSDDKGLEDDVSLLDAGIIDSAGALDLVAFLEDEYAIAVDDDEILPENLDSVQNIVAFLTSKREVAG